MICIGENTSNIKQPFTGTNSPTLMFVGNTCVWAKTALYYEMYSRFGDRLVIDNNPFQGANIIRSTYTNYSEKSHYSNNVVGYIYLDNVPTKITRLPHDNNDEPDEDMTFVIIPEGVVELENTFTESLRHVVLPNSLKTIGYNTFMWARLQEPLILPPRVETIGIQAFRYAHIPEITLPASLKTIGRSAFADNNSDIIVNYTGTMAAWDLIQKDAYWKDGRFSVVHCTDGDVQV